MSAKILGQATDFITTEGLPAISASSPKFLNGRTGLASLATLCVVHELADAVQIKPHPHLSRLGLIQLINRMIDLNCIDFMLDLSQWRPVEFCLHEFMNSDEKYADLDHDQLMNIVKNNVIDDELLHHISKIYRLHSISFPSHVSDENDERHDITDEGLSSLLKCKAIKKLDLPYCEKITNNGLLAISQQTSLRSLCLNGCYKINDTGLTSLAKLTSLQSLNLDGCRNITDTGLAQLVELTALQSISFVGCDKITDDALSHLAQISTLTKVILSDGRTLNQQDLINLCKKDAAISPILANEENFPNTHSNGSALSETQVNTQEHVQQEETTTTPKQNKSSELSWNVLCGFIGVVGLATVAVGVILMFASAPIGLAIVGASLALTSIGFFVARAYQEETPLNQVNTATV